MIELSASRPEWPHAFQEASAGLQRALDGRVDVIEHIGSTAIPGLPAKPVIDIAMRVTVDCNPYGLIDALESIGYELHRSGPKTHAVYVRSSDQRRTHILHVFRPDQWDTCNQRLFRDKLLRDAAARHRYAEMKSRIASTALDGREYTAAKSSLIDELLAEERIRRGLPPVAAWEK